MTLGPTFDHTQGRPEWSWADFLVRSTPSASEGAAAAQDALNAVADLSFWSPLLKTEELDDPASLAQVKAILDYNKAKTDGLVKDCRHKGHIFYRNHQNSFNPWVQVSEEWDRKQELREFGE